MAKTAKIEVKEQNPVASLRGFLQELLAGGQVDGLLVAAHLPVKGSVMPVLVTDPQRMDGVDPLAPAFPINAAKVVSRLTRKPTGQRLAVVLRPCEIRAFIELVKLKQGSLDEVVLIGMDCLGAYGNVDYARLAGENGGQETTLRFYRDLPSKMRGALEDSEISPACKACEHPVPENADLQVAFLGVPMDRMLLVQARTEKGMELFRKLRLTECEEPKERQIAVADLVEGRRAYRDRMFEETSRATADVEKLMEYLGRCVNCYNCRVACPVCYCKECVFVTDVFDHEPTQYLRWARRKGLLKMPTDTVFYHLTRLAHMSTACIGCGQCSNACPNGVPVMELFRTIAAHTQRAFDYEAGRSAEEPPPLSVFREKEFSEVTGGKD